MTLVLAVPALAAAAYYLLALIAAARWGRQPSTAVNPHEPPISILKPIHGRDPGFYACIRSHAAQHYPEFEILFGVTDAGDPAIEDIESLQREFPKLPISLHVVSTTAPNAKAGVLAELARHARHEILLVNDGDIFVPPDYLRAVAAPLADAGTGLVTCLYRAHGGSAATRMEALGIATDFAPSVLVARLLGVAEFALGSTMAFRAETLRAIGGFESIFDYLADDYQLGRHIHQLGLHIAFADVVVETNLGAGSWRDVWRHQLRWARTIRVSRFSGYCGSIVTHATLWSLVALLAGAWWAAIPALALRIAAGTWIAADVLEDPTAARSAALIPVRDLLGFAVWLAGLFGTTVEWRGLTLRLGPDGTIQPN
ncbi:MAG TPA: bacteriohopanetetrol glucosamine biosynthesis glycosyltransferase HpnI [Bryobacteraceae bacterium]